MRDLTQQIIDAFSAQKVIPAILAKFEFDSQTVGMWTGIGTLEYEGVTYFGGGNLVSVSQVQETQDLQAAGLVFNLNGVNTANIALALSENLQGRPCTLYLANMNVSAHIALEDDSGSILLENGDYISLEAVFADPPVAVFSGLMDVMEGQINIPISSIRLSAENILILLQRNKESRYTDEDQRSKYPDDKFFEFTAQLQDKSISW